MEILIVYVYVLQLQQKGKKRINLDVWVMVFPLPISATTLRDNQRGGLRTGFGTYSKYECFPASSADKRREGSYISKPESRLWPDDVSCLKRWRRTENLGCRQLRVLRQSS